MSLAIVGSLIKLFLISSIILCLQQRLSKKKNKKQKTNNQNKAQQAISKQKKQTNAEHLSVDKMALELKQVADGHTESNLYRLKSIFKTAFDKEKKRRTRKVAIEPNRPDWFSVFDDDYLPVTCQLAHLKERTKKSSQPDWAACNKQLLFALTGTRTKLGFRLNPAVRLIR